MRRIIQYIQTGLFLVFSMSMLLHSADAEAQNKKERVRLNASYFKLNDGDNFITMRASARIDRKTVAVSDIELAVSKIEEDEEIELGIVKTDMSGNAKFVLKDFASIKPDSLGWYHLSVAFAGNDQFKRASRDLDFRDASIVAEVIQKDSLNYIQATLSDAHLDSVLPGENLGVSVDRLFKPLKIGKDFYKTDDSGSIEVKITDGIPGVDGVLDLLVVLAESDDYGTVTTRISAPVGIPIVEESTFDQRTMWSPRGKTPVFLLFLTFSFIIVVWGIFVYLIANLFKIVKS